MDCLSSFTCQLKDSSTSKTGEVNADRLWIKHRLTQQSDRHRRVCTPPCFPKVGIYSASLLFSHPLTLPLQSKISLKLDISFSWRSGSRTARESEVRETGELFNNKVHLNAWLILTYDRGALRKEGWPGFMLGSPAGLLGSELDEPPGSNGPCEFQSKLKGLRMSWDFLR